jgi:DNA segregation ATPase FtsK/SpoIIIE, S-DNA-T family
MKIWRPAVAFPGLTEDVFRLPLGPGDDGLDRYITMRDATGLCLAGEPGSGKSVILSRWLKIMAPDPRFQFVILDGLAGDTHEEWCAQLQDDGSYRMGRVWLSGDDDLAHAVDVLQQVEDLRKARIRVIRKILQTKNIWRPSRLSGYMGPNEDWPIIVIIIDECQTFLSLEEARQGGDKEELKRVMKIFQLTKQLARKGRSAGIWLILCTQKPTADSLPTSIRDVLRERVCMAVSGVEEAVACLGAGIRDPDHKQFGPWRFSGAGSAGRWTAKMDNGGMKFTCGRSPNVNDEGLGPFASRMAEHRRDPAALLEAQIAAAGLEIDADEAA